LLHAQSASWGINLKIVLLCQRADAALGIFADQRAVI